VGEQSRAVQVQRAEQAVIRACHRGLGVTALREALLASLRSVMPVDAAFVATADPETLLFTGAYAEAPLDGATAALLDNEFGVHDVNRFTSLATSRRHVAWLDDATSHDRFASPRYRDIMRPLGLGDELRAALVVDRQCWGYLCLHREDGQLGFTGAEAATIARLGPHLAAGIRQAVLLHPPAIGHTQAPGVVLLTDELTLIAVTAQAESLLSLVEDRPRQDMPLPVAVYTVAAALATFEQETLNEAAQPTVRIPTVDGPWLSLHASRLEAEAGQGSIAVVVELAAAHATAPVLLVAHGLTAREVEVARLVLRGRSTKAIADSLHISGYTVQDHLKAVFDKTGVRSRRDLVGHFLAAPGHPLPDA
jgi:DNA-binding CsgD family transcriptional regulator